jgi:hypothetical protein
MESDQLCRTVDSQIARLSGYLDKLAKTLVLTPTRKKDPSMTKLLSLRIPVERIEKTILMIRGENECTWLGFYGKREFTLLAFCRACVQARTVTSSPRTRYQIRYGNRSTK